MKKSLAVIKEPDGIRGLVPSRYEGYKDRVFGEYLSKLNPRDSEEVQAALAASDDPRYQEFLERITSRRYRRVSMQTIAKACNISLQEFTNWWQKASTQRAIAVAQTSSIRIAEHMAEDAMSSDDVCPRCDGMKFVTTQPGLPADEISGYRQVGFDPKDPIWVRDCPKCDGEGKIRKPGDSHARDRIMEMAGILQRGKTPAVAIIQNFGGASHASAVSDLSNIMDISAVEE